MKIKTEMVETGTSVRISFLENEQQFECDSDAAGLDEAIAELVALRAQMRPAKKVSLSPDQRGEYKCDNLLWDTSADPSGRGVVLALYHGGLGRVTVSWSRAQLEDLESDLQFSLSDLARMPGFQNQRQRASEGN